MFALALMVAWAFRAEPSGQNAITISFLPENLSEINVNLYVKISLSIILIFIQAVLVNNLIIRHKLSRALSTIPAAFLILYSAWVIEEQVFHSVLIANFFFLLSLNSIFKIYKRHLPIATIFNAGFWLAIATLFYHSYLVYFIVLLIGLYSMRNISLRESLQLLFGLLAPLGFLAVGAFYFGEIGTFGNSLMDNFNLPQIKALSLKNSLKPALTPLLIFVAIFFSNEIKKKKKFDAIKKIELVYWLLLMSIFSIFLANPLQMEHLMMVSIPLTISLGLVLETKSKSVVKEFIFLLAIGVYFGLLFGII